MKLTREQAIEEHRKMWIWIAKNCIELINKDYDIRSIKRIYIEEHTPYNICDIESLCFCCEYNSNRLSCEECPIEWSGEDSYCCDRHGEYRIFADIKSNYVYYMKMPLIHKKTKNIKQYERRIIKLAYKIAMLEERKDNV